VRAELRAMRREASAAARRAWRAAARRRAAAALAVAAWVLGLLALVALAMGGLRCRLNPRCARQPTVGLPTLTRTLTLTLTLTLT